MPVREVTGPTGGSGTRRHLEAELAGLDQLEQEPPIAARGVATIWRATWPKLAAVVISLFLWQVVVWSGWRPEYVLPPPRAVFERLWADLQTERMWRAIGITMQRAVIGFALSVAIGVVVGVAVARIRLLRIAIGSMITGLQTMPSIAWFPLAILLFQLSEQAILFVVVLGAAPSIANGIISGIDTVPPVLLRAGQVLGARGLRLYRSVVLPAALPSAISGLKQGWAFAWRSLMAGELLVIIASKPSIGSRLNFARTFSDTEGLISVMIVILVIGVVVDSLLFGRLERTVLRRRGLAV